MKKAAYLLVIVFLFTVQHQYAQQKTDSIKKNIFEKLATPDSITKAKVIVKQDNRIEKTLVSKTSREQKTMSGFRVQVFSSNTQRTAKSEAFKKEKQIKEVFPEHAVYVNYTSPFWKVRVGDFKTQQQAQQFRAKLIELFPNMKSDAYIVKEQIIINGSK